MPSWQVLAVDPVASKIVTRSGKEFRARFIFGADGALSRMRAGLVKWSRAHRDAVSLLERSRRLLDRIHPEDREDAIDLHERIDSAIAARDAAALSKAGEELKELLFFVEDQ
jgi:flavin-dependent dehydrogenase